MVCIHGFWEGLAIRFVTPLAHSPCIMKTPIIQRSDLLLQFFFFIAFLVAAPPTSRAAINVVSYWRLGENDPTAFTGARALNTTDIVGGDESPVPGHPRYANDVAATAANRHR